MTKKSKIFHVWFRLDARYDGYIELEADNVAEVKERPANLIQFHHTVTVYSVVAGKGPKP